ncbi:MAG: DUF3021 domain-containing protein [Absicoccus porci]|jgi:hypothetical protein|uniref:DUF3021 domain-containing protein n=1 Tax=Absicoccus porci TaxID=2486576 RepID=A0A3N0I047_9FIRM|nr:DUF3021 domain-containing protein [Absicoccus porci]MCI6088456.1 DUF3021 domain-containing protein [Absicoccus porci]MDD7330940.1 DUF3021 domain-containing protein [Absicoccus porci]MDY4739583.1 DUF3021 domain-containing protein [Absicoccus porci]RNM30391.1 DUF3021 domain-containing protein [Absicoccus porci]
MKQVMKSSWIGVSIALLIFVIIGIIFDQTHQGFLPLENYQYTKMAVGTIIVGLGFGLPSLIYDKEQIPYSMQVLFHLGIGCAILLITGYMVGWFTNLVGAFIEIGMSLVVWIGFAYHYRKEAKQINQQLKK